jgi:hypothetical protein
MGFLQGLPRAWVSFQVPGTLPLIPSTYVTYPQLGMAVPSDVPDLAWLAEAPVHEDSPMAAPLQWAARDISLPDVEELLGGPDVVPQDVRAFLAGGLRTRLRSATDCYFDLADRTVAVEGGRLLHLISDSQWVFHWLLFVGDLREVTVVGTPYPAGFDLCADDESAWRGESWGYTVVADSFAEFRWRWWMDNELYFAAEAERRPLSSAQLDYARLVGAARPLG